MYRIEEVRALDHFRLHLRYADGVEGEVNLSHLAGRGVFEIWDEEGAFEDVFIGPGGAIAWSDEVEICQDSLYLQLTNQRPEDVLPGLAPFAASA